MSIRTNWSVLPVALLFMGTVASAQNQATSNALDPREAPVFEETRVERSDAMMAQPLLVPTADVRATMNSLSRAFAAKDLTAVRQLWPTIPQKPQAALQKSFRYFNTVSRNFSIETIQGNSDNAILTGSYSGAFVQGKTTIHSSGQFHATLRRIGSRWIIDSLVCN